MLHSWQKTRLILVAALLAGLGGFMASGINGSAQAQDGGAPTAPAGYAPSGKGFVENLGQYPEDVRFKATNNGVDVWLRDGSVLYATSDAAPSADAGPLAVPAPDESQDQPAGPVNGHAVAMTFVSAGEATGFRADAPAVTFDASGPLDGEYNWLIEDTAVTGAKAFASVTYRGVWPGIDATFTPISRVISGPADDTAGKNAAANAPDDTVLKSLWTLAPGADVDAIRLRYEGADALRLDALGNLVIETPVGNMVESAPYVYQLDGARRIVVVSSYSLDAQTGEVGFVVGPYDATRTLYIDPSVQWSRQISGTSGDFGSNVHSDATGLYYTGMTQSTNYPTTTGAFQLDQPSNDCFATKTDATNNALIWSTYIGGSGVEYSCQSVLEAAGTLVVAFGSSGTTPGTPTVIGTPLGIDVSVVRLNSTGTALLNSAEAGGTSTDYAHGIARLANGNFAITGGTFSTFGWPALGGAQPTSAGGEDAFALVLNSTLTAAVGFSYMGDASIDVGNSVASDTASNIYVHYTTLVSSAPKPLIAGLGGNYDLVVAKLNPTATSFTYHGRIGGTSTEPTAGSCDTCAPQNFYHGANGMIVVDSLNQAWVTGMSASTNWPTTAGVVQPANGGNYDVFITAINAAGTGLVASTFLGGTSTDTGRGIKLGPGGNVYVAGSSFSTNYPTTGGEVQTTNAGSYDYIRSVVSGDLTTLLCSTYWGGSSTDYGADLIVPAQFQTIQTGATLSANFPTVPAGSPVLGTTGGYNVGNVRLNCGGANLEFVDGQFINLGPRARPLIRPSQLPAAGSEECLAPGNFIEIVVTIENTGLTDQRGAGPEYVATWDGSLFVGQPGSCVFFIGTGTCTVTASSVTVDADIPAGGQIQFAWSGRLAGGLPSGTVIEIAQTLFFDSDGDGINDTTIQLEPLELILDCVPSVDPNRQLGRQVHLPILNFQGQDDVCDAWIEIQNIGCEFAKAALVTWGEPGFCPPQAAGPLKVECTGILKPGSTWNMFGAQVPTGSKGGMIFKFSVKQLSELPAPLAFPPDDITADYLCESLFFGVVGDADDYRRFKKAYNEGLEFDLVPLDRGAGDGILAVEVHRTCPGDVTPGVKVTSKYNGLAGSHLGTYDDVFGGYGYYVPLVYADKAGFNTIIYIQNGGLNCSSLELWFKAQDDCLRAKICDVATLAPGETYQLDASECVGPEFQGSVWIRSSQPMGIAVDIIGKDVLMTYVGEPGEINYTFDPSKSITKDGNQVAFGPLIYSEYQGWDTGVQVQNMSGVTAAKVKVYFLDRSGDIITTLVDWICPRGSQTFFLPVIFDLPGNWVGSMRAESQEWFSPGGPNVRPPNIVGVVTLIKYNDAARTETQEAIAYNLLPEHKVYDWQIGFAGGGLDSGVGLIAIPSLMKDLDNSGLTSEIAIANVVPKPGFTDLVIYFYDQNGLLDYICQKLGSMQVEYIDLQTWGYINPGYKGSAIISAWFWEHDVFDDTGFFLRNLVGLGAVSIERMGTRLGEDVPGDEAAGSRGIPFRQEDIEDRDPLSFCFMGFAPLCPGFPRPAGDGEGPVCIEPPIGDEQMATLGTGSGWPAYVTYQTAGRINRNGVASTCAGKACPGPLGSATGIYDLYYFNNCDGKDHCFTVTVNTGGCGTAVHAVAFKGSVPSDSSFACMLGDAEYVGDLGSSISQPFSFVIPGDADTWTLMFHNNFGINACTYSYTITEQ